MTSAQEWASRPPGPGLASDLLGAIVCRVYDGGTVKNEAALVADDVWPVGNKEVLGIRVEHTEGAKFWLRVMNDLKAR